MSIEKYIKDWEKLCDNDSELNSVRRQVATILKNYLTLMLDGIEGELPEKEVIDEKLKHLLSYDYLRGQKEGKNIYRQEVRDILNKLKK